MQAQGSTAPTPHSRPARVLEALDTPLLALALVAVALYLLELRGIVDAAGPVRWLAMGIDVLFVADTAAKLAVQRRRYLTSAWILVDVLSCLPAIALLAHVPFFEAIRFTRVFRFLRVLRSVRMLRALHLVPAPQRFAKEAERNAEGVSFRVALNLGVALYSVAFLSARGDAFA